MTRENAIKKLMESGMTEREANSEFCGTVSWHLRGTLRTAADRQYAVVQAIEDVLGDEEPELPDSHIAMLDMLL